VGELRARPFASRKEADELAVHEHHAGQVERHLAACVARCRQQPFQLRHMLFRHLADERVGHSACCLGLGFNPEHRDPPPPGSNPRSMPEWLILWNQRLAADLRTQFVTRSR